MASTSYRNPTGGSSGAGQGNPNPRIIQPPPGTTAESPGSTGFGLTPGNVDNYYRNPSNQQGAAGTGSTQFFDNWKDGAARDASWKAYEDQYNAQNTQNQYKVQLLINQAQQYAKQNTDKAQQLELASSNPGSAGYRGRSIANDYGIDLTTSSGRRDAKDLSQRLRDLASGSYVGPNGDLTGAARIVDFEHQSQANRKTAAHNKMMSDNAQAKSDDSILGTLEGAGKTALGWAGSGLNAAIGWWKHPYYASQNAELHGGSLGDQTAAFFGGVPGIGRLGNAAGLGFNEGQSGKFSRQTSTEEQRAALTKSGDLRSIGAAFTGDTSGLNAQAKRFALSSSPGAGLGTPASRAAVDSYNTRVHQASGFDINNLDPRQYIPGGNTLTGGVGPKANKVDLLSGAADAAATIALDPTLYAGHALGELGKLGEGIAQRAESLAAKQGLDAAATQDFVRAAKASYITESNVGKSVIEQTSNKLLGHSVDEGVRLLGRDVPRSLIADAIAAGKTEGEAGVKKALVDAFADGSWHPQVSTIQRALRATGLYTGGVGFHPSQSLQDVVGKLRSKETINAPVSDIFSHQGASVADYHAASGKATTAAEVGRDLTPLEQASKDAADHVANGKSVSPTATNQKLLAAGGHDASETVVAFRGEPAHARDAARGSFFEAPLNNTPAEAARAEAMATNHAGADGIVWKVRMPQQLVDAGRAEAARTGEVGTLLPQEWADAAFIHRSPTEAAQKEIVYKVRAEAQALIQSKGGLRAPLTAMNVDEVLDLSIGQAARLNHQWAGDLIANTARDLTVDPATRAVRLVDAAANFGSPGFAAAVEEAVAPLRSALHSSLSPEMQKLVSDRLDKLESTLSIMKGDAGAEAQSLVTDQIERKYSITGRTIAEEAAVQVKSRAGQELLKGTLYREADPRAVRMALDSLPDGRVKDLLGAELEAAIGDPTKFGNVAAAIDRLYSNDAVLEDVIRASELEGHREVVQTLLRESALHDAIPLGSKLLKPLASAVLSLVEKRPLTMLHTLASPFAGTNESAITDYMDRVSGLLGLSGVERQTLSEEAQKVAALVARGGSPTAATDFYRKLVNLAFEKNGLPPELAADFAHSTISASHNVQAFGLDDAGELVNKPFLVTQAQTSFHLDPKELMAKIREELASRGDHWAQMRVTFDAATNATMLGGFSIKGGVEAAFKFWKVMITTRLYAPLIGLGAGVVDGVTNGDDLWDGLQRAAVGGLIGVGVGAAGWLRYAERNWIQARASSVLYHGFTAEESVPGLSRVLARFQDPVYGSGANALTNNLGEGFFINGGLSRTTSNAWEMLVRTPKNIKEFAKDFSRLINYQVNPETDQMMMFFLQLKAGKIPQAVFDETTSKWLLTDAGHDWANKMAGMGISSPTTGMNRYASWVDRYITPEFANLRLSPEAFGAGRGITNEQITSMAQYLPEAIHRQATDSVFTKGIGGLGTMWKSVVDHAAYDAPSLTGAKRAFYNAEVARLEPRYIASGLEPKEAQQIVGEIATRNTQAVMFRMENTSRFSSKVDFISPFQGHREFNTKVWLKLASERPGAVVRYGEHAAHAFNAGKDVGIFQKDPTTGKWQMSVPGSGPLSRALFGAIPGTGDFKVDLSGFLAMTEGGLSPDGNTKNPWLNALTASIPRPGGPFWAIAAGEFAKHNPDSVTSMPPGLRNLIFGAVGPSTRFLPADSDRLWQAIAGSAPPWSLLAPDEQKNDTAKYELEIGKQLMAEHRKADIAAGRPVDTAWMPSDDQVKEGVKSLFLAWGFMRGVLPASPHPVFRDKEQASQAFDHFSELQSLGSGLSPQDYQKQNYNSLRQEFVKNHPVFAPFFDATTKYVGPDTMRNWEHGFTSMEQSSLEKQLGLRRELRWPEYKAALKQQADLGKTMDALHNAENTPGSRYEREAAMQAWRTANPAEAKYLRSKYFAEKELNTILSSYPKGPVRDQAIDRWRHQYAPQGQQSWTKSQYDKMAADIKNKGGLVSNPLSEARDSEVVFADVQRQTGNKPSVDLGTFSYVRNHLSPAEQVRYWTQAVMHLSYTSGGTDDANKVGQAYKQYTAELRQIYIDHPEMKQYVKSDQSLARQMIAGADPYNKEVAQWHADDSAKTSALYAELAAAKTSEQAAYTNKQYATGKMLSARIKSLYQQITDSHNATWSGSGIGMKDQTDMHNAIRELTYLHDTGILSDAQFQLKVEQANQADANHVRFLPSNEEAHLLAMPTNVRAAYYDNLVANLSIPPGQSKERGAINAANPDKNPFAVDNSGVPIKTYWSYLTNFQRSQLEKFMPAPVVDGWKAQDPSMEKGGSGKGKGGRIGPGQDALIGVDALKFARDLMRSYSQRAGMAKPAGYDEYLALPNNPAARNQFLDTHPDVASYITAGPMHNMPPYYAMMVQQIMIKNGKWSGDETDTTGMADLAFAKTQLQVWNQRGDSKAPATYDMWVNMPSGQDKATYLDQHPEIGQWLQLGPMANMPSAYREVVRDVMLRYHQWTATTDGLGPVIQNYYRTPSFARGQYLLDHPELTSYWQATQSPADRAMSDLTNQYYAIPDSGARSNFLSSHPELQQHLLDSRTKRYEKFLNQVAVYMGQQPALFQHYLEDQTSVLKDLLAKFATPNLAKEAHWMTPQVSTKSTESGRNRW